MKKINDAEFPVMNYVWSHEPVTAVNIVRFAQEELGWKKTTTYTVLKRLCDREILRKMDIGGITGIASIISKEDAQYEHADDLLTKMYNGSLKMFLVSFMKRENISEEKLEQLMNIADELDE